MTASPRVVFGVISAQQSAATVAQLVDALAPHPVWIHHDYTKRADFALARAHVRFVPEPKLTGWGTWGFVQAILHTIETALRHDEFDYFQLLSPSCLPIRPVADFVRYVAEDPADVHADWLRVDATPEQLMSFAYRVFAPADSWRFRGLRALRRAYFGQAPELRQVCSLSVLARGAPWSPLSWWARSALWATQCAARGWLGRHSFHAHWRPYVGSVWFGARRSACELLLQQARSPVTVRAMSRLHLMDETFFASIFGNTALEVGASNHVISPFDGHGHPRWLEEADWPMLSQSGRWFGRKFPESPHARIRQRALQHACPAWSCNESFRCDAPLTSAG